MNPTDQQIINDVGNLYAAAFDHSRPLKRETQFFLKSFESKNGVEAKEVLKATLDGTAPVVAKGLPEAMCVVCPMVLHAVHAFLLEYQSVYLSPYV